MQNGYAISLASTSTISLSVCEIMHIVEHFHVYLINKLCVIHLFSVNIYAEFYVVVNFFMLYFYCIVILVISVSYCIVLCGIEALDIHVYLADVCK